MGLIRAIENWHTAFADHAGFITRGYRCRLRNGLRFDLRGGTDDHIVLFEIYIQRRYAPLVVSPGATVIDIGANIGCFTVLAARNAARVIACEPHPDNFAMLQQNIALNRVTNVELLPYAISDKAGKASLYVPDDSTLVGRYSLYPRRGKHSLEVATTTLEELVHSKGLTKIDLVKIDCEGAEYKILYNASKDLLSRIQQMIVECHRFPNAPSLSRSNLESHLCNSGFRVYSDGRILYAANKASRASVAA